MIKTQLFIIAYVLIIIANAEANASSKPSNAAKQDWIKRIRKLDIEMMLPQHGRIFKGENVGKFLDWFEQLQVGSAISQKE